MCGRLSSQSYDNINQGKVIKNKGSSFVSAKGRLCFLRFSSPAGPDQTKWRLCFYKGSPWFLFSSCWLQQNKGFLFLSCLWPYKSPPLCLQRAGLSSPPAKAAMETRPFVSPLQPEPPLFLFSTPLPSLLFLSQPPPNKGPPLSLLQPARAEQRWPFVCLEPAEEKKQRKQRWPFVETKGASLFYNGIFPCCACGLSLVVINCSLLWLATSSQNCLARHTISRAHSLSKTEFVQDLLPKLQVAVVKAKLSCETSSTSLRLK